MDNWELMGDLEQARRLSEMLMSREPTVEEQWESVTQVIRARAVGFEGQWRALRGATQMCADALGREFYPIVQRIAGSFAEFAQVQSDVKIVCSSIAAMSMNGVHDEFIKERFLKEMQGLLMPEHPMRFEMWAETVLPRVYQVEGWLSRVFWMLDEFEMKELKEEGVKVLPWICDKDERIVACMVEEGVNDIEAGEEIVGVYESFFEEQQEGERV